VAAIFFVLLFEVYRVPWVWIARTAFLWATFAFTVISGVHYVFLASHRLRELSHPDVPVVGKKQVA